MSTSKPVQCLNLDSNQQKTFIKFFNSLPEKPATTIRFFDRTEYYTVHGDDARFSAICTSKREALKTMEPDSELTLDYLVLSKGKFQHLARELLLVKKYRVEVYVKKAKSSGEWEVGYKGSPGNLLQFEEVLFENVELMAGSSMMALQVKGQAAQKNICLAFVDTSDQYFALSEFVDDDNFTELEAIIVLLAPKECLLPSKDGEYEEIHKIFTRNNVLVTLRKRSDFQGKSTDIIQDLNNLLKFDKGQQKNAHTVIGEKKETALLSLAAAIKYLELTSDEAFFGQFKIRDMDLKRFVQMDSAAIAALNIYPKPGTALNSQAARFQSVLGVLDRCRTPQGHRLMGQWVVQPLRNIETINDRHNMVECFIDNSNTRSLLHDDYLKRFPDIMALTKKLLRKRGNLQDIYRLYQVVVRSFKIESILSDLENTTVTNNLCSPLKDLQEEFKKFRDMVSEVLDMDAIEKNYYFIKSSFDEELKEIKSTLEEIEEDMEKVLNKAADDLDLEAGNTIKLESNHLGYFLKITLAKENLVRNNKKYKTLDAIKSGVRFTTDKLTDLNDKYTELQVSYEEKQKAIVEEVMKVSLGYLDSFSILNNVIAEIDCIVSFAVAAVSAPTPYVRPKIYEPSEKRVLKLKGLRHPFVELQDNLNYIPNDIDFEEDKTQMYIITGPNMGGKSTLIRSAGCVVAMALMGSFVPCDEAEISIVDKIFGRVGACDDIAKGLSTFMREMVETAGILRNATKDSLVIIDELGRGTSTYEGCGLAWSIADYLATSIKPFTFFATHFHEIAELANQNETVKNYYMAALADESSFTLLYQLRPGVTDKSFGIHVAKLVQFPEKTIKTAEETYKQIADHFSEMRDEEAKLLFNQLTDKFDSVDTANDDELMKLINDVQKQVNEVTNTTFRKTLTKIDL